MPLVDAAIWVPALGDGSAIAVTFLADTGADMTVLHPQDSMRLLPTVDAWTWAQGQPSTPVGGAGQNVPHYIVDAWIVFKHEDGSLDARDFKLHIGHPHPGNQQNESLLGRDVLRHYLTSFDGVEGLSLTEPSPPRP